MQYIPRHIEPTILKASQTFKVVFVGGPRQVGKTTVLKKLGDKLGYHYITLDDLNQRELAKQDPILFLQQLKLPVIIDEVQYAPQIFPEIKKIVDGQHKHGLFWLTGSQQFSLIKNIQESLAGRVAVFSMLGLSRRESNLLTAGQPVKDKPQIGRLFADIYTGSFPVFATAPAPDREIYFNSYVQTYLDRDLSDLFGISKISEFNRFIQICAGRTGQVLNMSELARDSAVTPATARDWISILESTSQIFLLPPYFSNITKRLIKAPKLYFLDTGLAAYLTKWNSIPSLQSGSMAGALFETYVVSEMIKRYLNRGVRPPLYYLRDKEGHEVDLVLEDNGLHLYEIKLSATIRSDASRSLNYFADKLNLADRQFIFSLVESPITTPAGTKYLPYTTI